ncbi:MAG TPA: hypothetical protein PKD26_08905 [Pyrinomonadaceae bacterium]|nr:hypothetical protein [Pyrinomonadaceae bacterium]
MREALFVLFFVLVLLGLTAFRYRKQIFFGIQMWRSLNAARKNLKQRDGSAFDDLPDRQNLVSCLKCGSWVSENSAVRLGKASYYCSKECAATASPAH